MAVMMMLMMVLMIVLMLMMVDSFKSNAVYCWGQGVHRKQVIDYGLQVLILVPVPRLLSSFFLD